MGLKTTDYTIASLGLTLPTAYAIVSKIEVDKGGNGKATFVVQQDRENAQSVSPLEIKEVNFVADKKGVIFEQAYVEAKLQVFVGWEDDIPVGETEERIETPV